MKKYEIHERPSRHNGQNVTAYDLYIDGQPTDYTTMDREYLEERIAEWQMLATDRAYDDAALGAIEEEN